jgi:transcriptional regulator of acetoin/glycerol metabolism
MRYERLIELYLKDLKQTYLREQGELQKLLFLRNMRKVITYILASSEDRAVLLEKHPELSKIIKSSLFKRIRDEVRAKALTTEHGVRDIILKHLQKTKQFAIAKKGPLIVASGAIAAAIAIYKKYFSAAARACRGKTGAEKVECLKQFRINALRAKLSYLNASLSKCSQSDDPMTCRKKIQDYMEGVQKQIRKLESK